jgi:hypothetical protein
MAGRVPKIHEGTLVYAKQGKARQKVNYITSFLLQRYLIGDKHLFQIYTHNDLPYLMTKNWMWVKEMANHNTAIFSSGLTEFIPQYNLFYSIFFPNANMGNVIGIATGRVIPINFNRTTTFLVETTIFTKKVKFSGWDIGKKIWVLLDETVRVK